MSAMTLHIPPLLVGLFACALPPDGHFKWFCRIEQEERTLGFALTSTFLIAAREDGW